MSIIPPQKGWAIPGGGGSQRAKTLNKCMVFDWTNFPVREGGGGLIKNPLHWRGVDILWSYTFTKK